MVLAIGLVVDDAVVILENIYRHIQMGEGRLAAAYRGTRELGFAVIASTVVLLKETKPQLQVIIDRDRAGDLGVSIQAISRTLESKLGSRRVTTFIEDGEEYDVLVEGEEKMFRSPSDLANIQVRSERTGRLIPLSNLVRIEEFADTASLNRYNRIRSITIEANLTEGYSLGEALTYLRDLVRTELPPGVSIGYKGESLEYITSGRSIYFIFLLALVVVYLAMAAQFESYIHPFRGPRRVNSNVS